jgi:RNA polymerase sigma factor (sigma-70 family)
MNGPAINTTTQERPSPALASFQADGTDREILKRFVARRDESAFAALVARHGPMVLEVCCRVLHDAHEAEDACQATFLVLARKAGSFRRPELLANWLYGVAYRAARKIQRQTNRHRAHAMKGTAMQVTDATAEIIWQDLRPLLDEELDRLPAKCRAAVVLCYLEGLTTEEAAQQLGCPRGTILSRLARARERLRMRLAKRGLVSSAAFLGLLLTRKAPASISLPSAFVHSTANAACAFAAVGTIPIIGITPRAADTARGVLTGMLLAKLKFGAVCLLFAGVILVGAATAFRLGGVASSPNLDAQAEDDQVLEGDQASEQDRDQLQGSWRVVEYVDTRGKAPPDEIKEFRWDIEGDGFTMVGCHANPLKPEPMQNALGNVMQFRFRLDAGQRPKSADISVDGNPCWVAIYELNGETLRVCTAKAGSPRPTGFVPEDNRIVWVFKRESAERESPQPK